MTPLKVTKSQPVQQDFSNSDSINCNNVIIIPMKQIVLVCIPKEASNDFLYSFWL